MKEYRRVLFDKTRLSCSSQNLRGCLSLQVSLTELKKKCFVHKKAANTRNGGLSHRVTV